LAQQARQSVPTILAGARISKRIGRRVGQSRRATASSTSRYGPK
jgi:hypothetical protein